VRERVLSAVEDLHAADARCHESCHASFISTHNVQHSCGTGRKSPEDLAFNSVSNKMLHDRTKTWSSVELFALYVNEGSLCMCRKTLFRKPNEYHGENVLILSSPGFANVMGFRSELAQSLHLVKNTDDDLEYCVGRVASAVTNECLALKIKRNMYHINIDKELARESVGDTIVLLLSKISAKFDKELLAMMWIVNIIRGTVCSQPTDLQVALGLLMRRNKILISELSKYYVCCSYDEVRLFRYSAAVHVAQNYAEVGVGVCDCNIVKHCIYDKICTNLPA